MLHAMRVGEERGSARLEDRSAHYAPGFQTIRYRITTVSTCNEPPKAPCFLRIASRVAPTCAEGAAPAVSISATMRSYWRPTA